MTKVSDGLVTFGNVTEFVWFPLVAGIVTAIGTGAKLKPESSVN